MIAYHIAPLANLESIKSTMTLYKGNAGSGPDKSGNGVYFYFCKNDEIAFDVSSDMIEYLGFDDGIMVKAEVDENSLLMDEDALYFEELDVDHISKFIPRAAAEAYINWIKTNRVGWPLCEDDYPCNDPEMAVFKINLIDQFKIKPHKKLLTPVDRGGWLTARCTQTPIKVLDIKIYDGNIPIEDEDDIVEDDIPEW